MSILLTGGTGKVSLRLSQLLSSTTPPTPHLIASRHATTTPSTLPSALPVPFDWLDPVTHSMPFKAAAAAGLPPIEAVSLVAPAAPEPSTLLIKFVDMAVREYGVKRFLLIAGSSAELVGGPKQGLGEVWARFLELAKEQGVGFCVLRPTWFMENLSEEGQRYAIRDHSKMYTACADGKIPFVSATDIAAVAFRALTDPVPHNTDYRVLGPELLTYDQIAAKLTKALGRPITHVKLSPEERKQQLMGFGLEEHFARFLTDLEADAAKGVEAREGDAVLRVTGKKPVTFDEFAEEVREAWVKDV
ncbi:uncharacterized protein K452DRAFT_283834 [Aplosporella prunicola CBS 121167]|uniref:NmrA-like domain-containing protein n=1 Tax=Aplosporella prunicola CBS 121167 TaxID=1176127 RepID=A0A6A6BMY1_9PEZI|nr:uncharacterized protein K452DRAFT_283834 [Aplosporella prunicola CBS 121167]KAF2145480.1 hypothetical protein K452DRAFT_283834 [Aplosporella prunicola CBS 121167]